jgi:hypothetical protein
LGPFEEETQGLTLHDKLINLPAPNIEPLLARLSSDAEQREDRRKERLRDEVRVSDLLNVGGLDAEGGVFERVEDQLPGEEEGRLVTKQVRRQLDPVNFGRIEHKE